MFNSEVCTIYFVRPGPTPDNYIESKQTEKPLVTGRWSSSDATALSQKGIEEAQVTAKLFEGIHFDAVYTSQAERTIETARIILGDRNVKIIPKQKFYEMRIGPLEGKTGKEIIEYFCKETGYNDISTKDTLPKLWDKRKGLPLQETQANDCLLDPWHPDIDTFDDFYNKFMERLLKTVQRNLGKTLLIVPHGTPMKSSIAKAENVPVDRVQCSKGSSYVAEIDAHGNVKLKEETKRGISIEKVE